MKTTPTLGLFELLCIDPKIVNLLYSKPNFSNAFNPASRPDLKISFDLLAQLTIAFRMGLHQRLCA